jgi:16S rRNA (uracil1498-N3)-methyltransferase
VSLVPYVHLDADLAGAEAGATVPVDPEARHHLTRVLRLRDGAALEASDGRGRAAQARLEDDRIVLTAAATTSPVPHPTLTVVQGLPRSRKLDEVVRQVTELGADRVVPVAASRSVTRLDGDRADRAVERWRAVARAAAEQSRRAWRPEVTEVLAVDRVTAALPAGTRVLLAHVGARVPLPDVVGTLTAAATPHLAIAVGPEGGWSDAEVTAFVDAGADVVGLGPTVLRTEHAAAAALAVLAALAGRWMAP